MIVGTVSSLRLVTIGDPHLNSGGTGVNNLTIAASYLRAQNTKFDIVVLLGDYENLTSVQNILDSIGKPYYLVKGNHDGLGTCGGTDNGARVVNVNGYQLVFVGICSGGTCCTWDFNFNRSDINKSLPTIMFSHGPVQSVTSLDVNCSIPASCVSGYYGYACNMKSEVDKFINLLGYFSGHVHCYNKQVIGNVLYVTEDNLGGNGSAGDYIGFSCFNGNFNFDGNNAYTRLNYKTGTTIPDCAGDGTVACIDPVCTLNVFAY